MNITESKFINQLKALDVELNTYDKLQIQNKSSLHLINWFIEVMSKNNAIFRSKKDKQKLDQEEYDKPRRNVFLIDLGKTIGSEFQDEHYAVVLYEQKHTAVIIPLTTKKDVPPDWISNTDLIVDIDVVEGFPLECKECLAFVGGITSVSKKRLSRYGDKKTKKYYDIILTEKQMNLIEENIICKMCNKTIDRAIVL